MGLPTLTSGSRMSSAQRERPMTRPSATPATAPSAKPAASRASVPSACTGSTPLAIRRTNVAAMRSTPGNSFAGMTPSMATACQMSATTTKGNASPSSADSRWRRSATLRGLAQEVLVERLGDVGHGLDPSLDGAGHQVLGLIREIALHGGRDLRLPLHPSQRLVEHGHGDLASERLLVVGVDRGDRKSTRLNSSHLVISYAVF